MALGRFLIQMGAHIFLVGEDNFEVCTRRGVYGCVMPGTEWNKAEVIAGRVRYEGWLNAWFMRSLARGELMDIFLTHVATVDSIDVLYKYTCIELKVDRATEQDLAQILRYQD